MSKIKTSNGYKNIDEVYSGETYITEIYDKNGNVLYTADREIQNSPPMTFKSRGKNLKNYRIYGNTVNGESVGDRTGNLFDDTFIYRSVIGTEVSDNDPNRHSIVIDISNFNNGDKITFSRETSVGSALQMYQVTSPLPGGKLLSDNVFYGNSETLLAKITLDNISNYPYLMIFLNGALNPITDEELLASKIMVNVGDTSLPYEPYGYRVPVTVTNGTDTETTNLYLPEQIKMVGDEAEYVDYKEQKQHRVRKNLLQNIAASKTISGVTFTVNADGSVTCNGTNTANSAITFNISTYLLIGTYIINGCPKNGSVGTYSVDLRDTSNWYVLGERDTGLGFTFTNNTVRTVYYVIRINPGYTCDNLTFYPMVRKASITDDTYEPYIEDTELDVTLPALPTLSGTNTLSVGTEVQPSEVYVEGTIRTVN